MNRQSEEEVSEVKRRFIQSPDHEAVQNSPDWENIPYPTAVQVFSYLPIKDRINMAQVCRKWHNNYKDPSLWRIRRIVLDGKLDHRQILFTSLFGGYIQKVLLEICHEDNTCEIIAESVEQVLENLKTARLRHIQMIGLRLEKFEMFPEQKNIIIRCIKELFRSQTGLKTVLMPDIYFDPSLGNEILDNIAAYTGNGLERLYLHEYFSENLTVNDLDIFKETLTKFKNLKHISVNYDYISDEVLRHWAVSLHHKLELIEITAYYAYPNSHTIKEETWRKLMASCPKLKVNMQIYYLPSVNQILPLLQPSVPLNYFTLISDVDSNRDTQVSFMLKHLANCYGDTLEYLSLSFLELDCSLDNEVAYLIQRCRYQLNSIKFVGKIGILVPTAILHLLNDRQSVLRTVKISHFGETDPEMKGKIKLIDVLLPMKDFDDLDDDFEIYDYFFDVDVFLP